MLATIEYWVYHLGTSGYTLGVVLVVAAFVGFLLMPSFRRNATSDSDEAYSKSSFFIALISLLVLLPGSLWVLGTGRTLEYSARLSYAEESPNSPAAQEALNLDCFVRDQATRRFTRSLVDFAGTSSLGTQILHNREVPSYLVTSSAYKSAKLQYDFFGGNSDRARWDTVCQNNRALLKSEIQVGGLRYPAYMNLLGLALAFVTLFGVCAVVLYATHRLIRMSSLPAAYVWFSVPLALPAMALGFILNSCWTYAFAAVL